MSLLPAPYTRRALLIRHVEDIHTQTKQHVSYVSRVRSLLVRPASHRLIILRRQIIDLRPVLTRPPGLRVYASPLHTRHDRLQRDIRLAQDDLAQVVDTMVGVSGRLSRADGAANAH